MTLKCKDCHIRLRSAIERDMERCSGCLSSVIKAWSRELRLERLERQTKLIEQIPVKEGG